MVSDVVWQKILNKRPFLKPLTEAWTDYVAGKIDAKQLKSVSAGFGIYQQRDGKTMLRLRCTGGFNDDCQLLRAARILQAVGGEYIHLTTRQDIQMHGVPADQVVNAIKECENIGFHFRGGGGDTFRNIFVSTYSGLHEDSAFDVRPYARSLADSMQWFDPAFGLPRKLKIGFADGPSEAYVAQTNDLGFLAKIVDGKQVFETYIGGGIGIKPQIGFKIFDALPVEDCTRVAMALANLFNEHGNRENRAHARIRFLREDLGDEGLTKMLHEYMEKLPANTPKCEKAEFEDRYYVVISENETPHEGFEEWKKIACTPLTRGRVGVRIFIPFGNIKGEQLESFSCRMPSKLDILPTQDLGLVVFYTKLEGLYNMLVRHTPSTTSPWA